MSVKTIVAAASLLSSGFTAKAPQTDSVLSHLLPNVEVVNVDRQTANADGQDVVMHLRQNKPDMLPKDVFVVANDLGRDGVDNEDVTRVVIVTKQFSDEGQIMMTATDITPLQMETSTWTASEDEALSPVDDIPRHDSQSPSLGSDTWFWQPAGDQPMEAQLVRHLYTGGQKHFRR